jgi:chromosome segregation ATPase
MIPDEIAREFHDRASRGSPLSPDELQQLEEWLSVQDRAEAQLLSPKSVEPALAVLRSQVEVALDQVGAVARSIQQLSVQNDALRDEIAELRRRLAARPAPQPA